MRPTAIACLTLSAAFGLAPTAHAEEPVARVNGEPLTREAFQAYREGGPGIAAGDPGGISEAVALEAFINRHLLLEAARERQLASEPAVQQAIERARRDTLIEALLHRIARERVTDQRVARYYQAHFASRQQVTQVHLVRRTAGERPRAESLGRQLSRQALQDEAGQWVFPAAQLPALAAALEGAEAGKVVGPVASDGAWVVARVADRRQVAAPPLEEVRAAIRQRLEYQAVRDYLSQLRDAATIEYPGGTDSGS